jgi:hypothetical protein
MIAKPFALSGLSNMQFPTRGSLRSPLAIAFRASGAGRVRLPIILSFETAASAPTYLCEENGRQLNSHMPGAGSQDLEPLSFRALESLRFL